MRHSLEYILGLLDRHFPAFASADDFAGVHGPALRLWQRLGFLSREPEGNPAPSCPHCREGELYPIGGLTICPVCHSAVGADHLLLWRFDLGTFLSWLAKGLKLEGGVRQVEDSLWQLGGFEYDGLRHECFYRRIGHLSERGRQRLLAYRNASILGSMPFSETADEFPGPCLSLVEVLRQKKGSLKATDLSRLLRGGGAVRFDAGSGSLWAGDVLLGEVPVGSKEYFLLAFLSEHLDRLVPYGDIKHHVLGKSGSGDTTEEATFCQRLKNRVKKRVPHIDSLIATTNKGDGYRLRGHVEL